MNTIITNKNKKQMLIAKNKSSIVYRLSSIVPRLMITFIALCLLPTLCYGQDSGQFVNKGWSALGKRNFDKVHQITDKCIQTYQEKAKKQASKLNSFPAKGEEDQYETMNNAATCYFIKGEAYMREEKKEKAIETFQKVV
ncbi:MAG: hypothetical protein K9M14_05450, partial [Candidatus Omnitrophica bacterium]|nr:hypothetical protein [Candidatus Omnitrophota bacterium]